MSNLDSYRRNVQDLSKRILQAQEKKTKEQENISKENSKIVSLNNQIKSTKTLSTITSKLKDIDRCQSNIAKCGTSIAKYEKEISNLEKRRNEYQNKVFAEEQKLAKQKQAKVDKATREHNKMMANLSATVKNHGEEINKLKDLPEKITVLFLASNPRDQLQLSLDKEVRSITERINSSRHRDSVVLESRWAVRPGDILQHINSCEPTIVHFSGHGSENDELVLMDNNDQTRLVSLNAIVQAMSVANENLRLVFFNTCFSSNQASLVTENIECAIGMTTTITDEAAQYFSAQFYSSISFGLSVQKSFDQAKAALLLEGIDEADTPRLYIREGLSASNIYLLAA